MEYFVAKNVANITTESSSSSPLDSQAILGTIVNVENNKDGYAYVQTPDGYHGWMLALRLTDFWDISAFKKAYIKTLFAEVLEHPFAEAFPLTRLVISTCVIISNGLFNDKYAQIVLSDKQKGYVEKTSLEGWENSSMNENSFEQIWREGLNSQRQALVEQLKKNLVNKARLMLGTPYLWGGCTPFGIDCSGLSQLVYRLNGIQLLRNSYMQYNDKRFVKIDMNETLDRGSFEPGDILFFDTENPVKTKINHTGIACGDGTFIEASGHSRQGRVIVSQCSDPFFIQRYMGAVRLSSKADINLAAAK